MPGMGLANSIDSDWRHCVKKILDYTGPEPYIYCPRCRSINILHLAQTRRGEQFMCAKCFLTFMLVEAAIWEEEIIPSQKAEQNQSLTWLGLN